MKTKGKVGEGGSHSALPWVSMGSTHAIFRMRMEAAGWLFSLLVVTEEELCGWRVPFKKGWEARASDAGDLVAMNEHTANFFPVVPEKRVVWKDTEEERQLLGFTLHMSQHARTLSGSEAAPHRIAVFPGWDDLFIQPGVVAIELSDGLAEALFHVALRNESCLPGLL